MIVTGPPAAGKTTVAQVLGDRFGLPVLAKDSLKEALGEALQVTRRAESQRLGAAVFEVLALVAHELLRRGVSCLAEGNFTARSALLRDLPPARIVQVHVTAEPAVLRRRLEHRGAARHPVHYDHEAAAEIGERAAAGEWDPLPLDAALVQLETTAWPGDLEPFLAKVERALTRTP